ncbi:glycosyltransferase family 2 protein [Chitinibacteraceae bacterium HSL-7]
MTDRVSVVMPAFNALPYVTEAIDSVLAQTHGNWELLVVDDGATDGTRQVLEDYAARDLRIRVLATSGREGPARARNLAIAASTGHYIAFLDSDDVWLPEKLEKQLAAMRSTGAWLCYSAYYKIDAAGVKSAQPVVPPLWVDYRTLLKSNHIGCLTGIFDASALGRVPMPDIAKRQDLGLWLRLTRRIAAMGEDCRRRVLGLAEPLALYRVHAGTVSSSKGNAAAWQWKLYRDVERLSVPAAAYYFFHYAVRGFLKYRIR